VFLIWESNELVVAPTMFVVWPLCSKIGFHLTQYWSQQLCNVSLVHAVKKVGGLSHVQVNVQVLFERG